MRHHIRDMLLDLTDVTLVFNLTKMCCIFIMDLRADVVIFITIGQQQSLNFLGIISVM